MMKCTAYYVITCVYGVAWLCMLEVCGAHDTDIACPAALALVSPFFLFWGMARCLAPLYLHYEVMWVDMDTHERLWSQEWGIVCVWGSRVLVIIFIACQQPEDTSWPMVA